MDVLGPVVAGAFALSGVVLGAFLGRTGTTASGYAKNG